MADFIADRERRAHAHGGVYVGQTWGEFKKAMETGLRVQDSDALASIEYGVMFGGRGVIVRDDDVMGIEIREIR